MPKQRQQPNENSGVTATLKSHDTDGGHLEQTIRAYGSLLNVSMSPFEANQRFASGMTSRRTNRRDRGEAQKAKALRSVEIANAGTVFKMPPETPLVHSLSGTSTERTVTDLTAFISSLDGGADVTADKIRRLLQLPSTDETISTKV